MSTLVSLPICQAALVFGAGIGLSYGLSYGLDFILPFGLSVGLNYGLNIGLMLNVLVVLVRVILADTVGALRFAERIHWTWRGFLRPMHLRTSLIVAGGSFLFFGLCFGLSKALISGLSEALISGLSSGLNSGLNIGLNYWILLGLYQGMRQEHLEDQDRHQFNQGIHRSLRNGLLIGLMSIFLISVINGLSTVLSNAVGFGLSTVLSGAVSGTASDYWLSYGLSVGLSVGLSLLVPGVVVMWSLSGGLTILRHYVIRWLLARHRTFPFRAQAFLDDATTHILLRRVGGGYSFIHRRLQDYFADAAMPPSEN